MKIPGGYTLGTEPTREISNSRLINAPRNLVFAAFSDREHIGEWWGPAGFTTITSKMEFKPGGKWEFVMHGPDGRDYENRVVFDEIVEPELIISHHTGEGASGVHHYTVIALEAQGSKTLVTLRAVLSDAAERERVAREHNAVEGGKQNLERLGAFIEKQFNQQQS
jgi:uncharacterized protein YndB with AHSA1/START domain